VDSAAVRRFTARLMQRHRPARGFGWRQLGAVLAAVLGVAVAGLEAQTVYTWSGGDLATGTITPSTVSTLGPADTLNITTGANHDFNGQLLTNNGTVNWSAGNLRSGYGGTIVNHGTWNDSLSGYEIDNAYGGAGGTTFDNAAGGTYAKTGGTTDFTIPFTNAGTISVASGTLNLDAGGTLADGSVVGSSGTGVLQLVGGTLAMNGNITATNFVFNGGTLAGDQNFFNSVLQWQAGDWNSANTTTLAANTVLNVLTGNNHDFSGHAIVNQGTVNWTAGNLRSGYGGSITNYGLWNDTANGYQVDNAYGGAGGTTFTNAAGGTYLKSSGTTDFTIGFTNYGTVTVTGGTLNLDAGGTFYGGSAIGSSGSGLVQLTGGVLTGGDTGGFTATNLLLTGGQIAGDLTFLGTTNWVGSNFNTAGTATVGATGTLDVTTGNNHDFSGHTIVNDGTVNWTGGSLRSGYGGVLINNGVWNDSSDTYQINNAYGGAGGTTFHNTASGVYNKTAGTTTLADGVLVNDGVISVSGGVLNLVAGTLNDGSTLGSSGSGLVQLVSGVLTANGTVNVQNFLLNGGELTGVQTFNGTLSWLAGDLNPAGAMTVGSGGTLAIGTGNNHDFSGHTIVNDGTVNWTGGSLRSGYGGAITNYGVWNDSSDTYQINNAFGGAGGTTFVNAAGGVYNKTAGVTSLQVPVINFGAIDVTGGTLALGSSYADTAGVLKVGSGAAFSSASALSFSVGSLLTGGGTLTAPTFAMSGAIKPGAAASPGELTLNGGLTLLAPAFTEFLIGGVTQGTQYDHLVVNGSLVLGGDLQIGFTGGFDSSVNSSMTFDLVSSTSLSSSFLNVASGSRLTTADGLGSFVVNYGPGSPFGVNDVVLSSFAPIPEPPVWLLLMCGAGVGAAFRRLRSSAGARSKQA